MSCLAARRHSGVVPVAGGVDTKTAAGKGLPENTLVGTSVPVDICLDPGVACGEDLRRVVSVGQDGTCA